MCNQSQYVHIFSKVEYAVHVRMNLHHDTRCPKTFFPKITKKGLIVQKVEANANSAVCCICK